MSLERDVKWTTASIADAASDAIKQNREDSLPVSDFGLSIRLDDVWWPADSWRPECMNVESVSVALITSSTQTEGLLPVIVDWYIRNSELLDPDGWFGNDIPVVIRRADSTYTVRDGNHRCCAAILRGDQTITCHVVW